VKRRAWYGIGAYKGMDASLANLPPGARLGSTARGYDTRWQGYTKDWLATHPLCGDSRKGPRPQHSVCVQKGKRTEGKHVDHIVPHKGDMVLFWDPDNHQTLCETCHNRKTVTEDGGFGG
jgi:5-methylcytosine-specific restriction enzyme A